MNSTEKLPRSFTSLCVRTANGNPEDALYWWNYSQGIMEFLRGTHSRASPLSKLRDITEVRRLIFLFLRDPKVSKQSFCKFRHCSSPGECKFAVCKKVPYRCVEHGCK